MSAFGPKQTWPIALHSVLRGKADMTVCASPLSRSLLGAKRTCLFAPHMSASDPKKGTSLAFTQTLQIVCPVWSFGDGDEAARIRQLDRRRDCMARGCAGAAVNAGCR